VWKDNETPQGFRDWHLVLRLERCFSVLPLSLLLRQDVSGGRPVRVEGTDLPLWGMEIDVEAAKTDLREATGRDGGKGVDDFLGSVGLGVVSDQLKDLRLGAGL
jgi:hypothetical protein